LFEQKDASIISISKLMAVQENVPEISEAEAALYDRQIRLWGLDAQRRLRAANVFLSGLKGLGCEVAKNVILSGVDKMTLHDDENVAKTDFDSAFFIQRDAVGKNRAEAAVVRAQKLNPMVKITVDKESLASKDEDFFKDFHVVILTNATEEQMLRISEICHKLGKKFFAGDVFGIYGFTFADLGEHDYAEEIQKPVAKKAAEEEEEEEKKADDACEPPEKRQKTADDGAVDSAANTASSTTNGSAEAKKPQMETVVVKKHASFVPLSKAFKDFDWKAAENSKQLKKLSETYPIMRLILKYRSTHNGDLPNPANRPVDVPELESLASSYLPELGIPTDRLKSSWASFAFAELSPVCAIVGGVLGGEVIKAVSLKDAPHNNFFLYDGFQCDGFVEQIGAK